MARASSEAAGEQALEDVFDERAGDEGVEPFLSERGEAVAGADDGAGDRGYRVGVLAGGCGDADRSDGVVRPAHRDCVSGGDGASAGHVDVAQLGRQVQPL